MVNFIKTELQNKECARAVLNDIEGAFNTPYDIMEYCAAENGVSVAIIRWIRSMFTREDHCRQTEIKGQLKTGYPQGGLLPPKLRCFAVEKLLRSLTAAGISVIGYSDDIIILANGVNLFEKMKLALGIV